MLSPKKIGKAFYRAAYDTIMHDGIEHAGYLAFLSMLSFFPFLVLMVALAGTFGQSQLGLEFVELFINDIPERFIAALKPRIANIVEGPPPGLTTIAILAMIWTASSYVEGLRTILNRAYRVATPPIYIRRRLMSILQFMIIMVLLIAALMFLIIVPAVWENLRILLQIKNLHFPEMVYTRYGLTGAIVFLTIGSSYYILPNIKQKWSLVWPGTFVVMVLWVLAAGILSTYINNFQQVNLVYGSLEGIIVALLFFYILGVIYILGAEFNYQIERALGHRVIAKEKVTEPIKARRKTDRKKKPRKKVKKK